MSRLGIIGLVVGLVTACQPQQALPTLVSLEDLGTATAQVMTASAPPPTSTRRPLPATYTPTPSETPQAVLPATPVRATEARVATTGTIFYLYNDDSIVKVRDDGTGNTILVSFGVGQRISDVALSPDGTLLAFVAPGAGSAREVFITNLDGTYLQQVSCLGYADVRYVTWTWDNQSIAFFAAPLFSAPGAIYLASVAGANTCPTGNDQRNVVNMNSADIRGIAFNLFNEFLFYAGNGSQIWAVDMLSGTIYPYTQGSAFAGDYGLMHSPVDNTLAYFTQVYSRTEEKTSGGLAFLNGTTALPEEAVFQRGTYFDGRYMHWSEDGSLIVIVAPQQVWYYRYPGGDIGSISLSPIVTPEAAPRWDGSSIAYTQPGENGVEQIYLYDILRESSTRLTTNPDGDIGTLVWVEG